MSSLSTSFFKGYRACGLAIFGALLALPAFAGPIDLATTPLITGGTSGVKPNLLFVLDDSGSMNWDYLPDTLVDNAYCRDSSGKAYGNGGLRCCREPGGTAISSSSLSSTCLPQNPSTGANLDSSGRTNLRGLPLFHAADSNSAYYDPRITYTVPKDANRNDLVSYDGTTPVPWDGYGVKPTIANKIDLKTQFPDVEWCTDGSFSDCLRADNYLVPGTVSGKTYTTMRAVKATGTNMPFATGTVDAPSTVTRNVGPYYYVLVPGEYCTTNKLTTCKTANAPDLVSIPQYPFPAKIRWCKNTNLTECQAVANSTYKYPRYPTLVLAGASPAVQASGKITIGGVPDSGTTTGVGAACAAVPNAGKVSITSIKLNGVEILTSVPLVYCNGSNTASTRNNGLAEQIRLLVGNGFSASRSNAVLTINAPAGAGYNAAVLSSSQTGGVGPASISLSTAFAGGANAAAVSVVPGSFARVDIVPGQNYEDLVVAGHKVVDRSARTDCAARPLCTYAEELKNFANWFAYYRNRMQMMKSSTTVAFDSVDDRLRIGYFQIAGSSSHLVNVAPFDAGQRSAWYAQLFAAAPSGGTPLREALARAGRIYAGKTAITGVTDPVQYSCQKNFTLLSTDGYWNGNNGVQVNGATAIGNHDDALPRPKYDGGLASATLADVAAYYYTTDLRSPLPAGFGNCTGALGGAVDVCVNNVPTSGENLNQHQHMVTYTLGLGIDGVMQYRANYKSPASSSELPDDYEDVKNAATANPAAGVCPWRTSGQSCEWPVPGTDKQENIDDLWHAAVNGGGVYYSAANSQQLARGLADMLSSITAQVGGAAAATTSNPNITTGDNFVFSSSYRTGEWTGELVSQEMDPVTGQILPAINWSAQAMLDAKAWGSRTIKTFDETVGVTKLKNFAWGDLNTGVATSCAPPVSEKGCFSSTYIDSTLSQFCGFGPTCLSGPQKVLASGENLLNFLRGDRTYEQTNLDPASRYYRERKHVLGDIISAEAVYVGKYLFDYQDGGYPGKGAARANPSVYVAANDGMLHSLNAATGEERWAYVPRLVLRDMFKTVDTDYANKHVYLTDGTPVQADIKDGSTWRSIVVAGLGRGGKGFYALDISDQTSPKALWEFSQKSGCTLGTVTRFTSTDGVTEDCDIGYSYGNPVITKYQGNWVVMVTSGYNNHENGGNGRGYLYVLNALTGEVLHKLSTGVGSDTDPSGLARIVAWADNASKDNTTKYVYGGDVKGNLWRFDFSTVAPFVRKVIGLGDTQPITVRPDIGEYRMTNGDKKRIVLFTTGRLLGTSDLLDLSPQAAYGIWDSDSVTPPVTLVDSAITIDPITSGRLSTVQPSVFDDGLNLGWRAILPGSGERGYTDPTLAFGTFIFTTGLPTTSDACNPTGFESWLYMLDYRSGGVVQIAGDANVSVSSLPFSGAATRPNVVVLPSGAVKAITRVSGATLENQVVDIRVGAGGGGIKRISWRELLN